MLDIMGAVARAHASPAASIATKEIAEIGDFVCNSGNAQAFEKGLLKYAQAVTELDVQFLENVREEICSGVDAFCSIGSMKMNARMEKQVRANFNFY